MNGEVTPRIQHDSSPTAFKSAIEKLKSVTQVEVTRSLNGNNGYTWTITFVQDPGNIPSLTSDTTLLRGTAPTLSISSVDGTPYTDYGSYELNSNTYGTCSSSVDRVEQGACSMGNREVQTVVTNNCRVR